MLQIEAVDSATLELLENLMQIKKFSGLRLVGGTALALRMGHRKSIDLDLFGNLDVDEFELITLLKQTGEVNQLNITTNIKSLRVKNKMQTLIWLTNEIPFVMAPAALIAAMLGISVFTSVIRITQQASKVMMVGVMIALTVGVVVIQSVQ